VVLNCRFSGFREIDFQMAAIASIVAPNHGEANQILRTIRLKLGEIPALGQRLHQKMAVLVSLRSLEDWPATSPVLIG